MYSQLTVRIYRKSIIPNSFSPPSYPYISAHTMAHHPVTPTYARMHTHRHKCIQIQCIKGIYACTHTHTCWTMLYVIWTLLQSAQTTVHTCPPPHPSPQSNSQNHNVPSVPVVSTKSYWSDNCPHLFTIKHSQNHYIPVVSTKSSWSGLHCIVVRPLSTLPTHSSCTHKMCNLIRRKKKTEEKKRRGWRSSQGEQASN